MRFRPCIDLRNGKVVQIVGGTLGDAPEALVTNFETERSPADYARMYQADRLTGGHVIARHSDPARGVHALQIELDRRCYLDSALGAPGPGFDRAARFLETLAVRLGETLLGRLFATAAE